MGRGWRGAGVLPGPGNQSQGYYVGYGPVSGGSGSGMGQAVNGIGALAQGNGVNIGGSQWHPTVLYLFVLVLVEMAVFGFVGRLLK
jgi:hypothetical protein